MKIGISLTIKSIFGHIFFLNFIRVMALCLSSITSVEVDEILYIFINIFRNNFEKIIYNFL